MTEDNGSLLSSLGDLDIVQMLFHDFYMDIPARVARYRQLADLSAALGSHGTMLTGGELTYIAWIEARDSFVHGNYVATVLLCQGLAEHILAAYLDLALQGERLPERISFQNTLDRCLERGVLCEDDVGDLQRLMKIRNPLSHYRNIDDSSNLTRRVLNTKVSAESHLFNDASFAIGVATRLLSLPPFRLGA